MGKPKVLIADGINESACAFLNDTCDLIFEPKLSVERLHELIPEVSGLLVRSATKVTEEVLEKAKNLKIVGRAGVGTDNIDLKAATRKGIIVVNSPDGNTEAAAEHTIGMLMALARHIPQADKVVKSGGWRAKEHTGIELVGKNLGVIGFGKIGRRVAKVFQQLGMKILVHDPFLSAHVAQELHVDLVDLDALYAKSDFITLHTPKTEETANMINDDAFAKMKDGVRIVNCARGGVMDEAALVRAIDAGKVKGAALDVYDQEPPPSDHVIFTKPEHIITTPHLGASTQEAQMNVARDVAEQVLEYFTHGIAQSAVNIPAFRREVIEPVQHFMPMAEFMGNLVRQLAFGGVVSLEIVAGGTLAHENVSPLMLAALKGLLGYAREGVNYVNASVIAEEEGVSVHESKTPRSGSFTNLLTLNLTTDNGTYSVSGSVLSDTVYRIVEVNGYPALIEPSKYILFAPHMDKPGMIAKVSTVLGNHGINVSALQVARKGEQAGGESMMIFNLDDPVASEVMDQVTGIKGITGVKFIEVMA